MQARGSFDPLGSCAALLRAPTVIRASPCTRASPLHPRHLVDASDALNESVLCVKEAAEELEEAARDSAELPASFRAAIIEVVSYFGAVHVGTEGGCYFTNEGLVPAARDVRGLVERLTAEPMAVA